MTGEFYKYNGACLPPGNYTINPIPNNAGGYLPRPRTMTTFPAEGEQYSVVVNKQTHRVRFEGETESGVVIVVEPKN